MDEAARGFRLHLTSMVDVYKVFEHLDMLCMGIWVHPYTVAPVKIGDGFLYTSQKPLLDLQNLQCFPAERANSKLTLMLCVTFI